MSSDEGNSSPLLAERDMPREGRNEIAIRVSNLSKCYQIYDAPRDRLKQFVAPRLHRLLGQRPRQYFREFWALKDVSFEVKKGETVGIIGRNGSGKSTLLQLICSTLTPTSGAVEVNGRVGALLELGAGFNPEFTGRENVYTNAAILGFSKKQVETKFQQIADFSEIGEFMDQPVKTYSSGMFVRLAFAVQVCVEPDVLVVDEALAVGDVFFRQKCYARLEQLRTSGVAILLVSHSMPDIEQYCERAVLLHRGAPLFIGSASEASKHYYLAHQEKSSLLPSHQRVPVDETTESGLEVDINRPPREAFLDLTGKAQVSKGRAHCAGVALCNINGQACTKFRQGDRAIFYYEFDLSDTVGVPLCGVVVSNDRGVIVHRKNSWQFENEVPTSPEGGSKVICRQEIYLNLGPGEYSFEIGLASVSESDWKNRSRISHGEWASLYATECVVTNAGHLSIGFACRDNVFVLTHHGVADLPGKMSTRVRTSRE
jgi:lipopolysaccharide transport system ATP-binding protein